MSLSVGNSGAFKNNENKFDLILFFIVLAIFSLGLLNIYSAMSQASISASSYIVKQSIWGAIGILICVGMYFFDYRIFEKFGYVFYIINLIFLALVPFIGSLRSGARRWIDLGFASFQPSESMKLFIIIALAKWLHNRRSKGSLNWKDLSIPILIIFVPFILIISQPDLGTSGHLLIIGSIMLFFYGLKKQIIWTVLLISIISLPVAWQYGLKSYQKDRILTFLDPASDPKGKGFNAIQSMIAVGSGRITGKGFKKGTQTQLNFTPEKHTDFIFTVLAEEWGFLGVSLLMFLYFFLFQRAISIISLAREKFGALLGVGILTLLISQLTINLAMVCGIFPIVGIPLPLMSYGGTSLLFCLISIGIILNIGQKRNIF